ncbi:MAG: O-antigen ligase family protein [Bdellovibrio sp.]|nr:O-antigen ligase family protein [Bdellovibrio sp.]
MLATPMQIITGQMGQITAFIFFLLMIWVGYNQIKAWYQNPITISAHPQIRFLIFIFSVFIFIILTGFFLISWPLEWWTLGLAVAIGFSISILGSMGALSFLAALLLVRPWEISKADPLIEILPRAAAIVVLGMFLIRMISEKRLKIFWSRECTLLVLFAAWLFMSTSQGSAPAAAEMAYWETVARGAILFLMVVNILRREADILVLKNVLVGAALSVTLLAITYSVFFSQTDMTGRLTYIGLLGDPNDITAFTILAMPFAIKPLWDRRHTTLGYLFALMYLAISLVIIYLAQSRGAILALLTLFICIVIFKSKNKKRAILFAGFFALLYFPAQNLLKREQDDLKQSGASRIIYWKTAINMVVRHPLTGVGFNDYPNQYDNYLTDSMSFESGKRTAHSSWFLVLAEAGFIGFFLFFGIFLYSLKRAYKIINEYPEYLFSLLSYGVAMSFLSHTYLLFPYLIFAFTLVSSTILSNKEKI